MKRGADVQLTKDSTDPRDDDDEPGTGMNKASADELSKRKIRALPKRASAVSAPQPSSIFGGLSSAPAPASGATATTSIFGTTPSSSGSLFSLPTGGSKPFTFTASAPTTTSTSQTSQSTFSSSFTTPAASSTSKMFESILAKTAPSPNPSATTSTSTSSFPSSGLDEQLVDIYKRLRGLNVSLSETVRKAIEEDVFVDLTGIFDKYKMNRNEIQTKLENFKGKEVKSDNAASTSTPAAPKLALPPAPITFASFGGKPFTPPVSSAAAPSNPTKSVFPEFKPPSTTSSFGEFKPPSTSNASSSNLFGLKPSAPIKEREEEKPAASGDSTSTPPTNSFFGNTSGKSSFTFGASNSTGSSSFFGSSSTSAPSNFFAAPAGTSKLAGETTPAPSGFFSLTPKPAENSSTSTSTTNIFGGSVFGKPASTPSSGNIFGSGPTSTGTSATSSSSSTPIFGAPKPPVQSSFSFGTPASSETKPSASESLAPSAAASNAAEGSNSARSTPATDATAEGGEGGEGSELGLNTPNPHDLEGKGEEDEETVHSVKLKAYRLKKDESGASKWAELGLGFLRLKKHKETGNRRVLLRNSANGRILLNFRVYAGLNPTVMATKKGLSFIGHDEGQATSYLVRLPNEEATTQLKAALDREIEFVKAKSSDS
ncbi:hypothetical protein CVT24_003430 [Panaeolus cyanescens]|uniref:RanBD1 domain-containing protein n=1 Tax=Panaeolus cyanescens TaxID=181874 RepID=A0A409Y6Q3_9AGAR|nr:hypothetical protein CVT24_003430 [Panaeolus cyanescens]